ncbi:MAG: carboxypeptidase-like regulatory domain-containing protein [Paludibaculum sp.]
MSDLRWRLALILLTSTLLHAQSGSTGALEGTVLDAAGAPVPNASITIHNPATDQSHTATTDEKGSFRFSLLQPATYDITFSITGFKTARMPQMAISVSEVPVLEATLEPGNPTESIDCDCRVTSAAPSTGTLIDQKTITAVPLNTRNFTQVLSMSSGSAADVNNAGTLGRGTSSVNINGNTAAGAYTIDGASSPSTVPNPDTISEFKIQTSQYDAGFGAMVPNTNLVTRRGENDYHGNLWEFLRNDIFNANAFFRNSTGQPKPNLKQNQFGATLSGPILRNRWFFFGSYQGTTPDQRAGPDLHRQPDPARPRHRPFRRHDRRAVLPWQPLERIGVPDIRRRTPTRLQQPEHGHHCRHQPYGTKATAG